MRTHIAIACSDWAPEGRTTTNSTDTLLPARSAQEAASTSFFGNEGLGLRGQELGEDAVGVRVGELLGVSTGVESGVAVGVMLAVGVEVGVGLGEGVEDGEEADVEVQPESLGW